MRQPRTPHRPGRRATAGIAAALPLLAGLALAAPPAGADPATPTGRHALPDTKPAWATARADRGTTAGATAVHVKVRLAGRDARGLAAYAKAVSDPRSPDYGHFLTARQTDAKYGASDAQISAVRAWLQKSGLTVTGNDRHTVTADGSADAVHRAFGTRLHNYRKGSRTYRAPDSAATVPASLGGAVLGVSGLDNAPHFAQHHDELPPPPDVFLNSGPFSGSYGSNTAATLPPAFGKPAPYVVKGYNGKQLRGAYGAGGLTGKGATVAITDAYASPTIAADASEYARRNGDATYRGGQLSQVTPDSYRYTDECGASGWYGEETLDVEAVHAVAPKANIVYLGAASCDDNDLLDTLTKVVDKHLADIVTNSWSDVEANSTPSTAAAYDQVFQLGAVEGIGFYFSTGDDGDEQASTGTKQIGTPSDSAWATAVGGTTLAVGKHNDYRFETGWGTAESTLSADGKSWSPDPAKAPFLYGGGGGTSRLVAQPSYQRGIVPDSLATAYGPRNRTVPDIAAVGDPTTGMLVGQSQTFPDGFVKYAEYRIGGTSLSSPVIAGVQALAQQARGGKPIGFANPALYARYGTGLFHDVTDTPPAAHGPVADVRVDFANGIDGSGGYTTTLRIAGHDSSLHAVRGYDDVTGVGSPTGLYLRSFGKHRGKH